MSTKFSNEDWEVFIKEYYEINSDITIKDYCKEHKRSTQQFYYHKKRLNGDISKDMPVFQVVDLKDRNIINQRTDEKSTSIKITIGNAIMEIPTSEISLITAILRDLNTTC